MRAALAVGGLVLAGAIAGLALYARPPGGNGPAASQPCAGSEPAARRVDGAARGEVAAMQAVAPRSAPALSFKDREGAEVALSDLKGKMLLVNLWATWCAPCKAEMPALDKLQAEEGGAGFAVVAINVDTRNLDRPPRWLAENGIDRLAFYADPGGRVLPAVQRDTGSTGLPTTLLVDAAGCTIGVMKGPADWAGADARRLIRAALGRPG